METGSSLRLKSFCRYDCYASKNSNYQVKSFHKILL